MANYKKIIPFIKQKEGGLSKNPKDVASKNPVPDGSGYHTNKGVTWITWSAIFGVGTDSISRFYAMSDEDWGIVFKGHYWDFVKGDLINSQRIADVIVDWVWTSGIHYPEKDIQILLNSVFGLHLSTDGSFGQKTVDSINAVDEQKEFDAIVQRHLQFVSDIVTNNPSQSIFLKGWQNRINDLVSFEK